MDNHVTEPWYALSGGTIYRDIKDTRFLIAQCTNWSEQTDENAKRIVACVNACAGIPTDQLEAGILKGFNKVIEERDELLEIMRQIYNRFDSYEGLTLEGRTRDLAREAIAKCK